MYGKTFYHNTIRKYTGIFGTLFNDISVQRFNADKTLKETLEVPIAYAAKEEYISFINQKTMRVNQGGNKVEIQIILPRMSFDMTGYNYAPDRMQAPMNKMRYSDNTTGVNVQFLPVAYDFNFSLNIFAKHMDDGLQIVEQILPYFNPTVNWPAKDLPRMDASISHDIAIELTGNSFEVDYQGSPEDDDRILNWSMDFTLRGYLFRPTNSNGLIKTTIVDFLDLGDFGQTPSEQFIQKTLTSKVIPEVAGPNDPHTIVDTNEDFV